jgi:(p)ppGpp synthase/HD superfamily hydrolase
MNRYSVHGENMIAKADLFAFAAHTAIGQVRKYTNEPYIDHPRAVADMVRALPDHTWQQVVLALIHDTVEDTKIEMSHVRAVFDEEIADGLYYLTNVEPSTGNRARRHYLNCERLRNSPARVATVKCLDIFHNTARIAELDPTFAPQYLREKAEALESLRHADNIVWRMTWEQIANAALAVGAAS